jgi:hypothetical protein
MKTKAKSKAPAEIIKETNSVRYISSLLLLTFVGQILLLWLGYANLNEDSSYWNILMYVLFGITWSFIVQFVFTKYKLIQIRHSLKAYISLNLFPIVFALVYLLFFFDALIVIGIYILFWSFLIFFRDY